MSNLSTAGERLAQRLAALSAAMPSEQEGPEPHTIPFPGDRPLQLSARGIHKTYRNHQLVVPVLNGVDLQVRRGEFLAIIGQSGSGKSTLLHVLATLDQPDAGEVVLNSQRIDNLPAARRDALRNRAFGMVFQFYHLLPELTALENILSPLMIRYSALGYLLRRKTLRAEAERLLELVGLTHRRKHKPRQMSGGEMQRTAIARALIGQPEILLADEPTGNLDRGTGEGIMRTLRSLNQEQKLTIVMVTHDGAIADQADRTVRLVEGAVASVDAASA